MLDAAHPSGGAHHLVSLAHRFARTGDDRCAEAARALFAHWLDAEPLRDGAWVPPPRYNALDIPHRLGDTECAGWFEPLATLAASPRFDEAFLARVVAHAAAQLNYLVDHLYVARNILMSQADGLLTQGLRLSFIPASARWREVGGRVIADMVTRQFNDDGGSIEATAWYHFIAMNMLLRFHRLGNAMPDLHLHADPRRVAASFDYLSALVQPDGDVTLIGDCTTGLTDHGDPPRPCTLARVNERRAAVLRELGVPDALPPVSQLFPHTGQAMLRTDWSADATYIAFDTTRRSGYHWHPARNSVQIFHAGKRVLADPGRMTYADTPERSYAVSTRSHSTMNLNGWDQSDAPASIALRTVEGYDLVTGHYAGGYWPKLGTGFGTGIYAEHHRALLWVRGRFVVVLDNLLNNAQEAHKPDVECNWQLGFGDARLDAGAGRVVADCGGARLLLLSALRTARMAMSLHRGDTNPHRGWLADEHDQPQPAPMLRMAAARVEPWNIDLATVLVPFTGDAPSLEVIRSMDPAGAGAGRVTLRWGDGATDDLWWTRRLASAIGKRDEINTDAALVHVERDASGKMTRTLIVDGTHAAPITGRRRDLPAMFVEAAR